MLQLFIEAPNGYTDVSVYTGTNATTNPWMDWNDPLATRETRNVASFPIKVFNPDPIEYLGPSPDDNPELFVKGPMGLVMKETLRIWVLHDDDTTKKVKLSNPNFNLVREGRVRIKPNETLYTTGGIMAWFDKTGGIPNGEKFYLLIEFDPMRRIRSAGGSPAYTTRYDIPVRFYPGQVRHSSEVDIP